MLTPQQQDSLIRYAQSNNFRAFSRNGHVYIITTEYDESDNGLPPIEHEIKLDYNDPVKKLAEIIRTRTP